MLSGNDGLLGGGAISIPEAGPSTLTMANVTIAGKVNLADYPAVAASVARVEAQLGQRGRVLLRPSGTEPLIRVTLEGSDESQVKSFAAELAELVRAELAT